MSSFLCYFSLSCATSTIASASLNDFFNALTSWIISSVQWLLTSVLTVLDATSDPSTIVNAATSEYANLTSLAPLLLVLGLLVATLQALRHGDSASLWRVYLGVAPAAIASIFLAPPLASITLRVVDALSVAATASSFVHLNTMGTAVTKMGAVPSFGVFLLSGLVILAALLLWIELLLRTVVLTFLLVLVPVIAPLSTFPALRRVGWRLAETFLAVAGSKIVVVIALTLGLNEVVSESATSVLAGVVTLLLACATPFLMLRVVPFMEQSALHALDGVRQRAVRAGMNAPNSPAGMAVQALLPKVPLPTPPEDREDFGLPTLEGDGDLPLPPRDGVRPRPPVGTPLVRHGHAVYRTDEGGPVIGWHWDD